MSKLKKETVEAPAQEIVAPVVPEYVIGQKYLFVNQQNEFIASIEALNPLKVTEHSLRNGCKSEMELAIDSLDEYEIKPLSEDEAFRRLS